MSDDRPRSGEDDGPGGDGGGPASTDDRAGVESGTDPDGESEEWKFSLSDIERREAEAEADPEGNDDGDHRAPEPNSAPIVRGSLSAENAFFVALGMVVMIGVLFRLVAAGVGV